MPDNPSTDDCFTAAKRRAEDALRGATEAGLPSPFAVLTVDDLRAILRNMERLELGGRDTGLAEQAFEGLDTGFADGVTVVVAEVDALRACVRAADQVFAHPGTEALGGVLSAYRRVRERLAEFYRQPALNGRSQEATDD